MKRRTPPARSYPSERIEAIRGPRVRDHRNYEREAEANRLYAELRLLERTELVTRLGDPRARDWPLQQLVAAVIEAETQTHSPAA